MSQTSIRRKEKGLSLAITLFVWGALLIFLFLYKITLPKTEDSSEVVTAMLINFGDNRNGQGIEEPENQQGSISAVEVPNEPVTPAPTVNMSNTPSRPEEKVFTGENLKMKVDKPKGKADKSTKSTSETPKKSTTSIANTQNPVKNGAARGGDGRGNEAIGNLIRGRGSVAGSQGTGSGVGNAGDPLGGEGNGDSKIGVDRKLLSFIPGTMNRGGTQPEHSCTATGTVVIAYTVDKTGRVTSAKWRSGASDACIVSTAVAWVKQYVKAESAQTASSGTYKITF